MNPDLTSDNEQALDAIIAEYLTAVEAGGEPDRAQLLAGHPEFAAELAEFLDGQAELWRITSVLPGMQRAAGRSHDSLGHETTACNDDMFRCFGDYELIEEIARGGMGIVYRARQISLNRTVALKMILAGQFASSDDVKRFQIEAKNAAQLDHPNIVPVYEVGMNRGQHYFTMKLVEGGSLCGQAQRFSSKPKDAARLIATVAGAVHYAHQRGILHRDLKPGNILLDKNGEPQVTDFGLARRLEDERDLTVAGAMLGSPRYMAPEQATGEKTLTVAADVWSLGAVLYELLAGHAPFDGPTTLAILEQVKAADPPAPSAGNPAIDHDLDMICSKCLEKDPARRYSSAQSLANDLTLWLKGESISVRRVGNIERFVRWSRRRPAQAGLAALGAFAVVLVIFLVVGVVYHGRLQKALVHEMQARAGEETQRKKAQQAAAQVASQKDVTDQALARSEIFSYLARIAWAEREYLSNDVARAEQILDECPPLQRRWEWHHLKRLCHAEQLVIPAADGARAIVSGNLGREFISVHRNGTLEAWNSAGTRAADLPPPAGEARSIVFSPDGQQLVVANTKGEITNWRREGTGWIPLPSFSWGATEPLYACNFLTISLDGQWIAAATGVAVGVWEAKTARLRFKLPGGEMRINGIAFSEDGKWLVCGSGQFAEYDPKGNQIQAERGELRVWQTDDGKAARTLGEDLGCVTGLCPISAKRIAAAYADGTIKIWHLSTGRLENTLRGHTSAALSVAASSDGRLIVSGGADQTARIWDAMSGKELFVYHSCSSVDAVAFVSDERFASAGADGVRLWNATAGPEARIITDAGDDVALSPDGTRLAAASARGAGRTEVWNVVDGRLLWARSLRGGRASFGLDGKELLIIESETILRAESGQTLISLDAYGNSVLSLMGRNGILISGADTVTGLGCTEVWDVASRRLTRRLPLKDTHEAYTFDIALSPDGRTIATADGHFNGGLSNSGDFAKRPGRITLWDAASGKIVRTLVNGARFPCWSVAFSPDGKWLAAGGGSYGSPPSRKYDGPGGEVRVWELASGREVFMAERRDCIFRVAFSPDGSRLAAGGGRGRAPSANELVLTDTSVWKDVIRLTGHQSAIHGIGFSGDGKLLASADERGTVRIWNTPTISAGTWSGPVADSATAIGGTQ